ncbi:regulator of telomere elongation helicase 1-like [Ruditapes philippinarum]|uniref:regulator of telomere elongation helicase 1-like n=1 Tax=Ruditapes philippinarum TaxID=129788 RepID=UPI00295C0D0D|nr:regulator of telomere elongation helicase 1-like [Ruditapes philippinarum]
MPLLDIRGVNVNFPFDPYPCQVDYMNKVIECLQKDVNGVLESPTGTGKTLCLLCSSLAWQESRKAQTELNKQVSVSHLLGSGADNLSAKSIEGIAKSLENSTGTSWGGSDFAVPKIIYASRTHSQLSQVIQELKRTAYNSVKVSVIGSRDQLCIHEQVKKEQNNTNKVHMCRAKVNARTCYYYNHLDDLKKNSEPRVMMGNVVDIEDLVGYGQKNKVCPYYMARELKSDADITFMPYNYLLDPKTRKAHGVELQGSVVIFDEAHNLEKICEDSSSFDLKPGDLATAIEEVTRLAEKMLEMYKSEQMSESQFDDPSAGAELPDFTVDDLLRLKATLVDLEEEIDKIDVPYNSKGITKPGMFMYELLAKANIVYGNKNIIVDTLDKIVSYVTADASGAGTGLSKGAGLSKITDILKIIFSQDLAPGSSLIEHQEKTARSYKVHLQREDIGKKKKQMDLWTNSSAAEKSGKTLSYWCFSPGHSMNDLKAHGIKCIVLTSGTLSPLSSFTAEMQVPFPVQLENPHVIQKHQVWVGTMRKGPDGTVLNSNFETRFNPSYQSSLGNCIVNLARVTPNGLLIFYPSYPVMEKCLEHWKETNIWTRIEQYKQIFVESRSKGVLNDLMNDFYSKINDPSLNGAIFIAVCRGKVSEGLDFSDINGRAVVITGLPYPPYLDPKVVLKMQYLDEMKGKQGFQSLSGKEWYKQQASRAVNQAIGRVIRHKEDFGAIILCDTRFANPDAVRQLPVWVRPHVNKYDAFGLALKDVMVFFKTAEKMMPAPKPPKRSVSSSSHGAYFMPTITRSGHAGPSGIQPAHAVMQHVPSLKHRGESVSNDKLREQYQSAGRSASSSSQKSLFSALDHSEKHQEERLPTSPLPSLQQSSTSGALRKQQSKKKIVIKKRASESAPIIQESTEVSSKVSMSHLNSAESYIAEVKSTLSGDSYKMFSRALVEYKKTEDIDKVIEVLATLFTDDTAKHHLFAKFYRFVRAKHKEHFHIMCQELTGLATGYKAEDTVNKKRLQDNIACHGIID